MKRNLISTIIFGIFFVGLSTWAAISYTPNSALGFFIIEFYAVVVTIGWYKMKFFIK